MADYPISRFLKHLSLDAFKAKFIPVDSTYFDNTGSLITPKTNGANQLVKLDGNSKLPIVDGSNLTNVVAGMFTHYKAGLILSHNATTPNTKLDVAIGKCRSIQDNYDLVLPTIQTLDITLTSDRGGSLTNGTWYNVYLISNGSTTKAWMNISSDTSMANLPSGYTYYRRIGSVCYVNSSSGILKFKQWKDYFHYEYAVTDTTSPGNAVSLRITVPPFSVMAYMTLSISPSGSSGYYEYTVWSEYYNSDVRGPCLRKSTAGTNYDTVHRSQGLVRTSNSGTIIHGYSGGSAVITLALETHGYYDDFSN